MQPIIVHSDNSSDIHNQILLTGINENNLYSKEMPTGHQEDVETNTRPNLHLRLNDLRHRMANKMRLRSTPLLRECLAEMVGTCILVIYGCGVIAQVIIGDRGRFHHGNFMSIAMGWGMAVSLGVLFSGGGGPGLINPAITLAFALIGKVRLENVLPYSLSQLFGAFIGSLLVFTVYYQGINNLAEANVNGLFLVNHTGKIFVTMPGEGIADSTCFMNEIFGTMLLCASALAIVDKNNWAMPKYIHPFAIGSVVYTIVGSFVFNSGAALNPARDFGPRIMLLICGWGTEAFTSDNYYFWIPIFGPYIGAGLGAVVYEISVGIHLDQAGDPLKPSDPNDKVIVVRPCSRREKDNQSMNEEGQTLLKTTGAKT